LSTWATFVEEITNQIIALVMPETKKTVKIETPEDDLAGDGAGEDFTGVSASFEVARVFAILCWVEYLNK